MAKWLITGASGLLGHNACQMLVAHGEQVVGLIHSHSIDVEGVREVACDVMDFDALKVIIEGEKPDVILHCVAITNVDLCEDQPDQARAMHVDLSENLANIADANDIKLIALSTDQLWDGTQEFVAEGTPLVPLNVYAQTKADAERVILELAPQSLVVRTNFFGAGRAWRLSFTDWLDQELSAGKNLKGFTDIYYTPLAIEPLLHAICDLVEKNATGVFHVAGSERISKYDFMTRYADAFGYDQTLITPTESKTGGLKAKRPRDMSLSVKKVEDMLGYAMPTIAESFKTLNTLSRTQKRKVS